MKLKKILWSVVFLLTPLFSHVLVVTTSAKKWQLALADKSYQLAMAFTWPVMCLVLVYLYFVSKWMDRKWRWESRPLERLGMQLLLGIAFAMGMVLLLTWAYFAFFGNDFWDSDYFSKVFPSVVWMVGMMNALCFGLYFFEQWLEHQQRNRKLALELERAIAERTEVVIPAKLGMANYQVRSSELVCLERTKEVGYLYLSGGRRLLTDKVMEEANKILAPVGFFQISRSLLVNLEMVEGYQPFKNQQAKLLLKQGVVLDIELEVARGRLKSFERVWKQRQEQFAEAELEVEV